MKRALAVLLLAACAQELRAAEPVWGKEPCAHCAMLVSERAPAAQAVLEDGTRRFFDDVGCMVAFQDREQARVKAQWVRDGSGWAPAQSARYRREHTPMDFGFVGDSAGGSVGWAEVQAAVRAKTGGDGAQK